MVSSDFYFLGAAKNFILAAKSQGYTAKTFNSLAENAELLAGILDVLEGRARIVPFGLSLPQNLISTKKTITVADNLTFAERILTGSYSWVNRNIKEELFPLDRSTIGEWEFDLFHPNRNISTQDAVCSSEVDGWTMSTIEHVLAYGATFQDKQHRCPIVALGSMCEFHGCRHVVTLWCDHTGWSLCLFRCDDDWEDFFRFLRVRKINNSFC